MSQIYSYFFTAEKNSFNDSIIRDFQLYLQTHDELFKVEMELVKEKKSVNDILRNPLWVVKKDDFQIVKKKFINHLK